ncbi:MAG: hypothetical protein JWP04_1891 [Belnapia sp.]|jgi:hypothetical protein|nr:hypothetical protein [Belnapia sp.]
MSDSPTTEAPAAVVTLDMLRLQPIENRNDVNALFGHWRRALATDERFKGARNSFKPEGSNPGETVPLEAVKGAFEWRVTLRPAGITAGLDFNIRLIDKSASYTPLDRTNPGAFGRDPVDGATYALRQWYDTKRIGSRPLKDEALIKYDAPPTAELFHAASHANAGRGRLYLIVAKLTDPAAAIAQQTFDAIGGFHKVAAAAREDAW